MLGNCGVFHQFLLGKGGGQPVPQVDVGAAVRVLQAVFPCTAVPGQGAAIAKVQIVRSFHMDIADVLRDIFDLCFSE